MFNKNARRRGPGTFRPFVKHKTGDVVRNGSVGKNGESTENGRTEERRSSERTETVTGKDYGLSLCAVPPEILVVLIWMTKTREGCPRKKREENLERMRRWELS